MAVQVQTIRVSTLTLATTPTGLIRSLISISNKSSNPKGSNRYV